MSSQTLTAVATRAAGLRSAPAIPALVAAMGLWGGTYVITKYALQDAGPFTVLFLRLVIGALALYPFARRRGFVWRDALRKRYVLFGLTGMALHLGFEILGLRFTSASAAALVIATAPAVTVAFSIAFLGERLTPLRWAGIAASIAGVALVTQGQPDDGYPLAWLGNLLVFLGVVVWGVFTVQGKRLTGSEPALVATTAGTAAAVLLVLPVTAAEIVWQGAPAFSRAGIAAVVYLGLFASASAYGLWNLALRHVDASVAGPFINLVPVIGVLLALALGERMTALQFVGAAIVAAGVWLSQRSPEPATPVG